MLCTLQHLSCVSWMRCFWYVIPTAREGMQLCGQQQMGESSSHDDLLQEAFCFSAVALLPELWLSDVILGSRDKSMLQFRYSFYLAAQQACIHVPDLHFGFLCSERISRCMRNTVRTSPGQSPCGGSALRAPSSRWDVNFYQGSVILGHLSWTPLSALHCFCSAFRLPLRESCTKMAVGVACIQRI